MDESGRSLVIDTFAAVEGRGTECVLMGYIDDATGTVCGRFYDYEGTMPAMDSFNRYIKRYGIPQSVYLDKHSTYKSTTKQSIQDELEDKKPMSQFERSWNASRSSGQRDEACRG